MKEQPPDEYQRFVLENVRRVGKTLTRLYGGHVFGGIVRCLLDPHGVEDALQPGAEIFARYHTEETGAPGQVAQIISRHPLIRRLGRGLLRRSIELHESLATYHTAMNGQGFCPANQLGLFGTKELQ